MIILGIESSCDETSAAVLEVDPPSHKVTAGQSGKPKLLSFKVSSSVKEHAKYGGIIPEIAARKQIEYSIPVIEDALRDSGKKEVDAIAVTVGPGLATALQVGIDTAKSLAYAWQKPLIPVNHIEGHLLSPLLDHNDMKFPAVALIVSGGHTELILMKKYGEYELLGRTRDDAAGEAFDKVAKLLDLGYPGGPVIGTRSKEGNKEAFDFPRGMMHSDNYDFSFSGLKTAVLYESKKHSEITPELQADIAASFQQSVVDVLVHKTIKAAEEHGAQAVLLGGGVSANQVLRETLAQRCEKHGMSCHLSPLSYSGDNAAMIALAGYYQYEAGRGINSDVHSEEWQSISAQPNLKLI